MKTLSAFDYINNYVFVKLKPSRIAGVGVFAIKEIPPDTFIFKVWDGESGIYPISQKELNTLEYDLQVHIRDLFQYSTDFPSDTNLYVRLINGFHWIYTNPYLFVNSGLYENKSNIDKDTGKSIRFIKCGEEILSNYWRNDRFTLKRLI
jgi:hypothetical protein